MSFLYFTFKVFDLTIYSLKNLRSTPFGCKDQGLENQNLFLYFNLTYSNAPGFQS